MTYRVASYTPDGTLCKQQGGFATPADAHAFIVELLQSLPAGLCPYQTGDGVVIWNTSTGKAQRVILIRQEESA